jgi:hypothetical protein
MFIKIDYIKWFYGEASIFEKYILTLYSMVILVLGGNIAPVNNVQVIYCVFKVNFWEDYHFDLYFAVLFDYDWYYLW